MRLIPRQVLRLSLSQTRPVSLLPLSLQISKRLSSNMSGPPKHEMAYFPNMVNALPSESAEFRKVLWTGLYSQVVLMTIPVGGDIGEEVGVHWYSKV